jgi:hypothetical protein
MNVKTLIASIALALIGTSTQASDATQFTTGASTQSRADVQAELARAVAAGEVANAGDSYGSFSSTNSGNKSSNVTRAQVIAEYRTAAANGELNATSDSYGSFRAAETASTLTRAEVRAQVRNGGLSRGNYGNYAGG